MDISLYVVRYHPRIYVSKSFYHLGEMCEQKKFQKMCFSEKRCKQKSEYSLWRSISSLRCAAEKSKVAGEACEWDCKPLILREFMLHIFLSASG